MSGVFDRIGGHTVPGARRRAAWREILAGRVRFWRVGAQLLPRIYSGKIPSRFSASLLQFLLHWKSETAHRLLKILLSFTCTRILEWVMTKISYQHACTLLLYHSSIIPYGAFTFVRYLIVKTALLPYFLLLQAKWIGVPMYYHKSAWFDWFLLVLVTVGWLHWIPHTKPAAADTLTRGMNKVSCLWKHKWQACSEL